VPSFARSPFIPRHIPFLVLFLGLISTRRRGQIE
jgi:hypothetical protein